MIYPGIPPKSPLYTPIPFTNQPSARNNQILALTIHEETYLERAKLNYKQKEPKRSKNYTQAVFLDSYLYSRGGRTYTRSSLAFCCYDTSEDCCFNCETCCCFLLICPMRNVFFMFYLLVKYPCAYTWRCLTLLSDSSCFLLERVSHGLATCFQLFFDLCGQFFSLFACLCAPFANCCKKNGGIPVFCGFFTNCEIWDQIGNCCSAGAEDAWKILTMGLGACEWVFENGAGFVMNFGNFLVDGVLGNCLEVGKFVCENVCGVFLWVFEVLLK